MRKRWSALIIALSLLVMGARPYETRRISLDVHQVDVHNVLRLLAEAAKVNIVVPKEVQGKVTLKLKNVAWKDVLQLVLRSQQLGVERVGEVFYVDTLANLAASQEMALARQKNAVEVAELVTVIIPVNYARAADLAPIVESMLTERGSVVVDQRTNVLIVTDVGPRTQQVRRRVGTKKGN